MTAPFCDYFAVSTPRDNKDALMSGVQPAIDMAGGTAESENIVRFPNGGTIKHYARGQVYVCCTSGAALGMLRALDVFNAYLWGIADAGQYRVTQMHATLDIPVHAPPVVQRLYDKASKGGLHLTRKAIPANHVHKYFGKNAEGEDTGTVYIGRRTNKVWAKAYDKRQERLDNAGYDPGPLLRIEVSVAGDQGLSLRDVAEPEALFYHYASPELVEAPPDVPAWVPTETGFKLPPRPQLLPAQRLMRLLSASPDIQRALELAELIGPHGKDFLYRKLDQMCSQAACAAASPSAPVAAAAAAHKPTLTTLQTR